MNKIKYLGFYNRYVNILPLDKQLNYETKFRGDILYTNQELIKQLIENKIFHDKLLIERFQRIIFTIRNNHNKKSESSGSSSTNKTNNKTPEEETTKENKVINEFILRLPNINILNDEFILFLQSWKNVCASYKLEFTDDIKLINNNNNNYIDTDNVINNNKYNILIRYLLIQLIQLIDMNNDKTNINLCSLISLIFDLMWEEYSVVNNYEINKFLLILYSGDEEVTISSLGADISPDVVTVEDRDKLSEEQKAVIIEAEEDFKEENEALDVEPMDEDEKDLGEDNLAMMMHDPENADGS
jgi:hypothetical protein